MSVASIYPSISAPRGRIRDSGLWLYALGITTRIGMSALASTSAAEGVGKKVSGSSPHASNSPCTAFSLPAGCQNSMLATTPRSANRKLKPSIPVSAGAAPSPSKTVVATLVVEGATEVRGVLRTP